MVDIETCPDDPATVSHGAIRCAINYSIRGFTTHDFSALHVVHAVGCAVHGNEALGIRVASAQQFGHDRSVGT
jgi:hypothetical protein